jgi:hypothetical protein
MSVLLISLFTAPARANLYPEECCPLPVYDDCCGPLMCGSFGLEIQAGIRPIIWRNRGSVNTVNSDLTPSVVALEEFPRFRSVYKLPWQIGIEGSYALSCNTGIFAEFNYAQARHRDECTQTAASTNSLFQCASGTSGLALSLSKYKLFDAFVGVRYYFDRWCDSVSLFIGSKVGLIHHKNVNFDTLTQGLYCTVCSTTGNDFFRSSTGIAGGGQLGLDIWYCDNWAFVAKIEVVGSCGPRSVNTIALTTSSDSLNLNGASNLIFGHIQTEVAFPITVGVKYNF